MQTATPDVLVVGAGPVGLTMAAELARHGVSCRIIDQLAVPLRLPRIDGLIEQLERCLKGGIPQI
jgi:2-polyprenyl-6-methoxyphenol hydroxylase-like FAD-dependent oxidoreductase